MEKYNIEIKKTIVKRICDRVWLIVGIFSMFLASVIIIFLVISFFNSYDDEKFDNELEVFLDKDNFVCSNSNICEGLIDNIVDIKDLTVVYGDKISSAIILDKDGYVYLKCINDVVKLKGKTKLKSIDYVIEVESRGDIVVTDENSIYYIDIKKGTIKYEDSSSKIKYIIDFNNKSEFRAVTREGRGGTYYSCANNEDVSCNDDDNWFFKEVSFVRDIDYATGEVIKINDKLYSKNIMINSDISSQLILDGVEKVWGWDNLKSNVYFMALTKDNKLYMVEVNYLLNYMKFNILLEEKVEDVYFINAGFYGRAVVVCESKVYLIVSKHNDKYEKYVEVKELDEMGTYIEEIKGFYSNNNKLFVLLNDGNTYLVKDFSKDN